jgi:gluconokinase
MTPTAGPPSVVVVMGVSSSGKTTVGALLAGRLHWEFEDADWLHPPANIDKMQAGIPLTDEDRWPWLEAVARSIDLTVAQGLHTVLACSALKKRYRDILLDTRPGVQLVYLKGSEALIARRMALRHGHFMPRGLLHSQFETLEEPGADENAIVVSVEPRPHQIVADIIAKLGLAAAGGPAEAGGTAKA